MDGHWNWYVMEKTGLFMPSIGGIFSTESNKGIAFTSDNKYVIISGSGHVKIHWNSYKQKLLKHVWDKFSEYIYIKWLHLLYRSVSVPVLHFQLSLY